MLSKTTRRFEILLEVGPDPLVGMGQKVRHSLAEHQVDRSLDRGPGSIGFDVELDGRQRDAGELPVSISLSRHTWGVVVGHGGG